MGAVPWLMGGGLWTVGRDPLTCNITGNFYEAAKKLKQAVDPANIMNPNIGFIEGY
jgi:FAD/FMN-containing dehydrogenase